MEEFVWSRPTSFSSQWRSSGQKLRTVATYCELTYGIVTLKPPETSDEERRSHTGKPTFQEQWHAQVIAVVELLVGSGKLDPAEWSEALGAEHDRRSRASEPDNDVTYYAAVLAALGILLDRNGLAVTMEVNQRENEWRRAYLNTPHGKPVVLPEFKWST